MCTKLFVSAEILNVLQSIQTNPFSQDVLEHTILSNEISVHESGALFHNEPNIQVDYLFVVSNHGDLFDISVFVFDLLEKGAPFHFYNFLLSLGICCVGILVHKSEKMINISFDFHNYEV